MKRKIIGMTKDGKHFTVGMKVDEKTNISNLLYFNEKGRDFVDIKLSTGQTLRAFEPSHILYEVEQGFKYEDGDAEGIYLDQLDYDDIVGKKMDDIYLEYVQWCEEHEIRRLPKFKLKNLIRDGFGLVHVVKKIDGKPVRVFVNKDETIQTGE